MNKTETKKLVSKKNLKSSQKVRKWDRIARNW